MHATIDSTSSTDGRVACASARVRSRRASRAVASILGPDLEAQAAWDAVNERLLDLLERNTEDASATAIDRARLWMLDDDVRGACTPPVEMMPSEEGGVGVTLLRGQDRYHFYFHPDGRGELDVFRGRKLVSCFDLLEPPFVDELLPRHSG